MSVANKLLQAAAGNASDPVYVDDVFSTFLYTGNSTNGRQITNGIDLSGEGGLVWIKMRESDAKHRLHDTERGINSALCSNNTDAAETGELTSFNNNGFSLTSAANVNTSATYASWTFRKQEKFFDVVTYTGNGTAGRTISHNLGSVPGMIVIKQLNSGSTDWIVWHRAIRSSNPQNFFLKLNSTAAEVFGAYFDGGSYSNVLPTSTEITLGDSSDVNGNGNTFVMYLFAHNEQEFGEDSDEAIIKCGSFTGNTASVDLGFEPQWVMFKRTDSATAGDWHIYDIMRGFHAPDEDDALLYANNTNTESLTSRRINLTSTGFDQTTNLYSGATYIYMAIARPHKPASEFAATDLFKQDNDTTTTSPQYDSGFPVDFALQNTVDETGYTVASSRLTGRQMYTPVTDAEEGNPEFDYSTGYKSGGGSTNADDYAWMWRRAKGFFDVVAYNGSSTGGMGSGATQVISHNLGVAPEYIIVKRRNGSADWIHWTKDIGAANRLFGDTGALLTSSPGHYFGTSGPTPTATTFTVGDAYYTNLSGSNYIAYLFASVDGISKVGTYTGTGSDLNVDCGFSAGVRFVLIKRTDSSGAWYVYDSVRGIVAGNDPYLLLNSTATEVTNTDYIDPLNAGFTITSSAPAELNASGGTYIFLAIA